MYNQWLDLRKPPFSLTPDPAFLFLTDQHREAVTALTSAILQRKGFIVLTGDAGTGKTTLLARILQFLPSSQLQSSVILNTTLTSAEFLESVLLDFGATDVPSSKALRLRMLQNLILQGEREGRVSALIIDEAHNLSREVLEEIRMLGNFEEADKKYLQILLIGQNELDNTLAREDMRQLKQRISVRLSLAPLAHAQIQDYVQHRWMRAGGTDHPFSQEALQGIAHASRGIPRVINALCDRALVCADEERSPRVLDNHVREAANYLDLGPIPYQRVAIKPATLPSVPPGEKSSGAGNANGAKEPGAVTDVWTAHMHRMYGAASQNGGRGGQSKWARWIRWARLLTRGRQRSS